MYYICSYIFSELLRSPLVTPRTSFPLLYSSAIDNPSIFVSTTYSISFLSLEFFLNVSSSSSIILKFKPYHVLISKSYISPYENTSCKLLSGTSCSTLVNKSETFPASNSISNSIFVSKFWIFFFYF